MSHLGSRVSALVDGRLGPEEEERCWAHVHACHTCRDLVEHEGWVKTQLAQLSYGASRPSHDFKSALVGRCSELSSGSSPQGGRAFPTSGHRSRRGLVAIGGGAASACTDLSRPVGPVAPVTGVDDRSARGPVSPSRMPLTERLVALREKIAP